MKYKIAIAFVFLMILLSVLSKDNESEKYNSRSAYGNYSSSSSSYSSVNTRRALTREEADKLRGTGYKNTRPGSSAENMEIAAAMVKCRRCGMHSSNGSNSLCNSCRRIENKP